MVVVASCVAWLTSLARCAEHCLDPSRTVLRKNSRLKSAGARSVLHQFVRAHVCVCGGGGSVRAGAEHPAGPRGRLLHHAPVVSLHVLDQRQAGPHLGQGRFDAPELARALALQGQHKHNNKNKNITIASAPHRLQRRGLPLLAAAC